MVEGAPQVAMSVQHGLQQLSSPAAHIHPMPHFREGIGLEQGAVSCPERSPMAVAESLLSAVHTVLEIVPAAVVLVSQQARKWPQRLRMVASQQLCQGREAEVAADGFRGSSQGSPDPAAAETRPPVRPHSFGQVRPPHAPRPPGHPPGSMQPPQASLA